jgi:predicted amidohydrolase
MSRTSVRLAIVQPRTVRPDESVNVERAVAYAHEAADQGARIVAFPECYPGPYSSPVEFSAEGNLGALCRQYGIYVAYGFMEPVDGHASAQTDSYHNIYQILGPDGAVAVKYAKMIPSPADLDLSGKRSIPGSEFALIEIDGAKIGVLICWEAWFPELCRTLAMRGADVVLFPTGGMLYHLAHVWGNLIQARATENLIYTASSVNVFGVEDGFAHICAPERELASSRDEGVIVADLDLDRLDYLREQDESMAFPKLYATIPGLMRHNRPELYQPLK